MSSTELPDLPWRKSSHSNGQANCVEAAGNGQTTVCVRDSKTPDAVRLAFTARAWRQFTESIRSRGFHAGLPNDLSGACGRENRYKRRKSGRVPG